MRKNRAIKSLVKIVILIIAFTCMPFHTGADAPDRTAGGFSIRAVIPENQVDKDQTYFDLRMKPGQEQTIQVVITNSRPEKLEAEVQLNAAATARNGLIVYTGQNEQDEIMEVAVTDIVTPLSRNITVPAHSSETVDFNIKMPEESFDGVMLGSIAVKGNEDGNTVDPAQGISLENTITYVTALKLTENDNEVPADFDLVNIEPKLINYKTAVVATLRNQAARIVKNMDVRAWIYQKGSDTVLYELAVDSAEMAPLSKGAFVIDWKNEALRPGEYRLRMTADYDGRTWEWDEEFTIAGEARDLNNAAIGIKKNYIWLYLLIGLSVLALVWLIAYRMGKREKKHEE